MGGHAVAPFEDASSEINYNQSFLGKLNIGNCKSVKKWIIKYIYYFFNLVLGKWNRPVSALEGYPGYPRIPQYFRIYSMKFTKKILKILCIKVGYPNMKKLTHSLGNSANCVASLNCTFSIFQPTMISVGGGVSSISTP